MQSLRLLMLAIGLAWLCQIPAVAESNTQTGIQNFTFGGFKLIMSEAEQKKSFPHSVIQHSDYSDYITVAPQDRKDLVTYGSIFKHKNQPELVQVHFEYDIDPNKPADYYRNEFNQYPRCETVLAPLIKSYGPAHRPADETIEGLRYHYYLWETDQEKLVLFCARYLANKSKKTFASAVQISRSSPKSGCSRKTCIDPMP